MDQLDAMRVFVEVADAGSFSEAARRLKRDVSVVNRQVTALEKHIGRPLVDRLPRQVTLTASGVTYVGFAREVLETLARAESALKEEQQNLPQTFFVYTSELLARTLVVPQLDKLRIKQPHVAIEIRTSTNDGTQEGPALSVRVQFKRERSRQVIKILGPHEWGLLASRKLKGKFGPFRKPEDICAPLELLMLAEDAKNGPWFGLTGADRQQLGAATRLMASSPDVLLEAAVKEQGVALVPLWMTRQGSWTRELVRLLPTWQVVPAQGAAQVIASFDSQYGRSEALREVLSCLADAMRETQNKEIV